MTWSIIKLIVTLAVVGYIARVLSNMSGSGSVPEWLLLVFVAAVLAGVFLGLKKKEKTDE